MSDARFAGVGFGVTNTQALVATASGRVLGRARAPTPKSADGDTVAAGVVAVLEEACAAAGTAPETLTAVGVGAAGSTDTADPAVVDSVNHPAGAVPLRAPIADRSGDGRVTLCNDAVAGVLGERRFADAPENTVYLALSSGVGAGACVDGHVLTGWWGNAAEVGHVVVDSTEALSCGCGGAGHWEAYAGGENLPRYARHLHGTEDLETTLDPDSIDAADLFAAAERGDTLAETVLERLARWNALGVAALVHAYAPEVVSVGGAVALGNPGRVVDPVRERLPDLLAVEPPALRVTPLGEDVVVRGALALALPDGNETR